MSRINDQTYLQDEQYKNAGNLNARIRLHHEFSTNKYGWFRWVFDHYDLPSQARILELGCGPGDLWLDNMARIPSGWGVVCDLIRRLADLKGEDPGDEPWVWYEAKYGREPDYATLLDALARTPAERNRLLTAYFEPDEEERRRGWKQPTAPS